MSLSAGDPLFSVIVPTCNAAHLVRATIDSVVGQSFRDFELIVVDDGSSDGTPEVLGSYGEQLILIRQENRGAEASRYRASRQARGQYLVLLDHDDLLLDDALAVYADVILSGEKPALLVGRTSTFSDGEPIPCSEPNAPIEVLVFKDYFRRDRSLAKTCSQLVIRRELAESMRVFRSRPTAFPYDSSDIFMALGAAGPCVAVVSPSTVAYRYHAQNSSGGFEKMVGLAPRLLNLVRNNEYEGEERHRFNRYASTGGILFGLLRRSVRGRRFDLSAVILRESWPMLLAAVARNLALRFRPKRRALAVARSRSSGPST